MGRFSIQAKRVLVCSAFDSWWRFSHVPWSMFLTKFRSTGCLPCPQARTPPAASGVPGIGWAGSVRLEGDAGTQVVIERQAVGYAHAVGGSSFHRKHRDIGGARRSTAQRLQPQQGVVGGGSCQRGFIPWAVGTIQSSTTADGPGAGVAGSAQHTSQSALMKRSNTAVGRARHRCCNWPAPPQGHITGCQGDGSKGKG